MDITRLTTEATVNLLFKTTRASLHPHWISSDEEEEEDENPEEEDYDHDEIRFSDENNEANNLPDEDNEANNLYWTDH